MFWITLLRSIIFGASLASSVGIHFCLDYYKVLTLLISFAIIGIAAHMANTALTFLQVILDFQSLAIACSALSMVMVIPL